MTKQLSILRSAIKPWALPLAVFGMPLVACAAPSINITSIKTHSDTTNGIINISGMARDTGTNVITAVNYSLNGAAFTTATGTNEWLASGLALQGGLNSFEAYATDQAGRTSRVDKVSFTFIVLAPITVTIEPSNSWGNVSVTNGELLEIGKKYPLNAKPAKGFKFAGWQTNGVACSDHSHLSIEMATNLNVTAVFEDATPPKLTIVSPGHTVSEAETTVSFDATDELGVTNVVYQLNEGGWNNATAPSGGNTWTASLNLSEKDNSLEAYAVNSYGLTSRVEKVSFVYSGGMSGSGKAPASLAGMSAVVNGLQYDDGTPSPPLLLSFGVATMAQSPTSTNASFHTGSDYNKVGAYTYTPLSADTAEFTPLWVAPPNDAGTNSSKKLTFSSSTTAATVNQLGHKVTLDFAPIQKLVPSPSSVLTISWMDTNGNSGSLLLNEGIFTNESESLSFTNVGYYTLEEFSPVVDMIELIATNDLPASTNFIELTFSSSAGGIFFDTSLDSTGSVASINGGSFSIISSDSPPPGWVPATLEGLTVTVTPAGSDTNFVVSFGECTYSRFDPNINDTNSVVGDYTMIETSTNTAELVFIPTAPYPDGISNTLSVELVFTNDVSGTGSNFSFTVAPANNLAPASVAGMTITSSKGDVVTFSDDGTFTHSNKANNGQNSSGTYTYTQYSPDTGMIVAHGNGSNGATYTLSYLQLYFTASGAGTVYDTEIGTPDKTQVDSFTLR